MKIGDSRQAPARASGDFGRHRTVFICLVLVGLVLWTFLPAIQNGYVNYDDPLYVTHNGHVQRGLTWAGIKWAFASGHAANWHPVTWISLMADCQLFGLAPWGQHLTNVLLHALNTMLLFLVLLRLTGATWRSAIVAALFGLHPLRVESVAWVAERKDVLSGTFWMLTLLAYTSFTREMHWRSRRTRTLYWLSLLFFCLGLMSKPMLVTLPCVLLLLDYWPLKRLESAGLKAVLVEKIPFFLATAAVCFVTYTVQHHAGAVTASLSLSMRLQNAAVAYCRYLGKLFWPVDLAVFYPYPSSWPAIIVLVCTLLLVVVSMLVLMWRRQLPWLVTGWFWFLGTLVPVIGLVQVGDQSMADRYTYLPSIGILLLVVWGLHELSQRWHYQRVAAAAVVAAAALPCLVLTREQIGYWRDSQTLFRHAIQVTKGNYMAHNNLGTALASQGHNREAEGQFLAALREKPGYPFALCNLGEALLKQGRLDEAIAHFQAALKERPSYGAAYCNLGAAYEQQGKLDRAAAQFRMALKEQPEYAEAHLSLGVVFSKQGHFRRAIAEFQQALRDNPNYAEAQNAWGTVLDNAGHLDAAISHYLQAVRLNPGYADAYYNLGGALARSGHSNEAIKTLKQALQLKPDAEAYNNLGVLLERKGLSSEAIRQYRKAIQLRPDAPRSHFNLAVALCKGGHLDEGIHEFWEALRLKPDYAQAQKGLDLALRAKQTLQHSGPSKP